MPGHLVAPSSACSLSCVLPDLLGSSKNVLSLLGNEVWGRPRLGRPAEGTLLTLPAPPLHWGLPASGCSQVCENVLLLAHRVTCLHVRRHCQSRKDEPREPMGVPCSRPGEAAHQLSRGRLTGTLLRARKLRLHPSVALLLSASRCPCFLA